LRSVALPLVFVVAVAVALGGCRRKPIEEEPKQTPGASLTEPAQIKIIYPAAPGSFVELVDRARDSVVNIRSKAPVTNGPASLVPGIGDQESLGSGFIASNDGHILTADHLIAGAGELEVQLRDGRRYPAAIVGRDSRLDVALLVIEAAPPLHVARMGSSDKLQVGEWVVALGNPFGPEVVISAGVVSGLGLTNFDAIANTPGPHLKSFVLTDARITAINDGGPLVNTAGEVVGIATATRPEGGAVGFAVPIDRAEQILPMLKKEGKVSRAWLGLKVREVDRERAIKLGLDKNQGGLVTEVIANGPGARAGIEVGDVIVEFDGKEIGHRSLPWLVSTAGIDRAVDVVVVRGEQRKTVQVVLSPMPE
jgi:serine protease Do